MFPRDGDDLQADAIIVNGTRSKRLILADHTSERRLKLLLSRIEALPKREIERLAKG